MEAAEVVIVGGGAAGLAAFQTLRAAGCDALLLEARPRLGGRVHTLHPEGWPLPVELGAEFVHGASDGLGLEMAAPMPGRDWNFRDGTLQAAGEFAGGAERVLGRMRAWQGPDMAFADFLCTCGDLPEEARTRAFAFIEGYEAADPARISIKSLNREFAAVGLAEPRRPVGGYDRLLTALHSEGRQQLNWPVEAVSWRTGAVEITGPDGAQVSARRAILTLPLSLLQRAAVRFTPPLNAKRAALDRLAMGGALRITLRLRRALWRDVRDGEAQPLTDLRFLFAAEPASGQFHTWWTHAPAEATQIVGWAAGRHAAAMAGLAAEALTRRACADLALRLGIKPEAVAAELLGAHVHDWQADPWTRGAYSYATAGGADAFAALAAPLAATLYFAGEATDSTGHHATVQGAVASGRRAAAEVLATL